MPILRITTRAEFCAAYRLANPALSDAENREAYGVCFSPHGHGHNYLLEVSVEGEPDARTGMVMDLNRLQRLILERLIAPVEHKHLNHDVPFLEGVIPTAENVAVVFWRELEDSLIDFPGAELSRIRLRESRMNYVDYYGPHPPRARAR